MRTPLLNGQAWRFIWFAGDGGVHGIGGVRARCWPPWTCCGGNRTLAVRAEVGSVIRSSVPTTLTTSARVEVTVDGAGQVVDVDLARPVRGRTSAGPGRGGVSVTVRGGRVAVVECDERWPDHAERQEILGAVRAAFRTADEATQAARTSVEPINQLHVLTADVDGLLAELGFAGHAGR